MASLKEQLEDFFLHNMSVEEQVNVINIYASESGDDVYIYPNDEEGYNIFKTRDDLVRALLYGEATYSDPWFYIDGAGNIYTFASLPQFIIDELDEIIDYIVDNKLVDYFEECGFEHEED